MPMAKHMQEAALPMNSLRGALRKAQHTSKPHLEGLPNTQEFRLFSG